VPESLATVLTYLALNVINVIEYWPAKQKVYLTTITWDEAQGQQKVELAPEVFAELLDNGWIIASHNWLSNAFIFYRLNEEGRSIVTKG